MIRRFLSWLKSFFVTDDSWSIYKPTDRGIYSYFNGTAIVSADPMELYRALVSADLDQDFLVATTTNFSGDLPTHILQKVRKDADEAYQRILSKVRAAFSLKPVAEGGLPEDRVFELFTHFMDYTDRVKKNSRTLQTTLKPSADWTPISKEESLPILPISDSGSIESGQSTSPHGPQPLVP